MFKQPLINIFYLKKRLAITDFSSQLINEL